MWISAKTYIALVDKAARVETRADWLLTRVNQLEQENGALRFELTGKPQPVPVFQKQATPQPEDGTADSYDDLGDELARKHGYGLDD